MPLSSYKTISFAEPVMAGDGDRLLADALHQVAVRGEHIGVMVDDAWELRSQHPLGDRHADRGRDALPERPGGGLDADGGMAIFRMARRLRAELAERLQIVDRQGLRRRLFRSGRGSNRAASTHGRPIARTGRGPASAGRRRRTSGRPGTGRSRRRPRPSAGRDGRCWPSPPRRRRESGSHWPGNRVSGSSPSRLSSSLRF